MPASVPFLCRSPVDPGGLEPPHFRLKGGCSTIELRIRSAPRDLTPRSGRKAHLSPARAYAAAYTLPHCGNPARRMPGRITARSRAPTPAPGPPLAAPRPRRHPSPVTRRRADTGPRNAEGRLGYPRRPSSNVVQTLDSAASRSPSPDSRDLSSRPDEDALADWLRAFPARYRPGK